MAALLPPNCARRYRLGEEIAQGGCGSVYNAVQVELERPVALKLLHPDVALDPSAVERFRAEARLTAQLSHPHIVKVVDFDVEDGIPWIAYELVPGPPLRARIRRGMTRWPMAVRLMSQVASALACAHAAGVLHRDIKPENILEGRPGHAKVTDFGIARFGDGMHTEAGFLMGTPAYVSPELARGQTATAASDIYAIGITLFELLTTRRAFNSGTVQGLLEGHIHAPVPRLDAFRSDLPDALVDLNLRMLAKDPAARPPGAGALAAELEALIQSTDSSQEELMPIPLEVLNDIPIAGDAVTPPTRPVSKPLAPPVSRPSRKRTPAVDPVAIAHPGPVPRAPGARPKIAFVVGLAAGLGAVLAAYTLTQLPAVPAAPAIDATVATSNAVLERQRLELDASEPEQEKIKPLLMMGSPDGQEQAGKLARRHSELAREQARELDEVLARLGDASTLPRALLVARIHANQVFLRMRADRLQQRARMADRARAEQLDAGLGLGRLLEMDNDVQYDPALLAPLAAWFTETEAFAARVYDPYAVVPPELPLLFSETLRIADQMNVYHFRGAEAQARFRELLAAWRPMIMRDLFEIGLQGDASRDPARLARVLASLDRVQVRIPAGAPYLAALRTSLQNRTKR